MNYPELYGYFFEELKVGMSATMSRTITDTDMRNFSGVSGDTNPMHLNEEFARATPFGGTIVFGMLTASLISAVVGTKLPGPGCIYMNQTLKFLAPVHVGETVYAVVTVKQLTPGKNHVLLETKCYVHEKPVIEGEALIKVTSKPS